MISFVVPGIPAPKGSTRAFIRGGRAVTTAANTKTRPWADTIAWHARQVMEGEPPTDKPVNVRLHFYLPRPKSVKRATPAVKPDGDKLERAVWDALTGIVWIDDAQVVEWSGSKSYAYVGQAPGVRITVQEAE